MEQLRIIWSDNDIIVAIKPAGVLSEDHRGGMPELLRGALGDPKADVRSVHRLDRAVSGLMVYARNAQAASALIRDIAERKFEKQYLAVTEGVPAETEGRMEDLLYHSVRENKTYVVDRKRKGVREAVLEYRVLQEKEGKALVLVRLLTGRTHQIRVQFASRKLPLAGDYRYGASRPVSYPEDRNPEVDKHKTREQSPEQVQPIPANDPGIALWSYSLCFRHPVTRKPLSFQEPPPATDPWCLFTDSTDVIGHKTLIQ